MEIKKMEIFLLPLPAAGHLTSMMEMASRLLAHNPDLSFTVLIMTTPIPILRFNGTSYIHSLFSSLGSVRFVELPFMELTPQIKESNEVGAVCSLYVDMHKPHIKAALSSLLTSDGGPTALVIDFFATMIIDVADELGVPTYLYFTGGAAFLSLVLYGPVLEEKKKLPVDIYKDDGGMVEVPGLPPIPVKSMPTFMISTRRETYEWFLYHGRRFRETKGMILNSFSELEPSVLKAIADGLLVPGAPPVYTIGPVIDIRAHAKDDVERHMTVNWLDGQPQGSVVFLCFGSTGVFTAQQLKEMAGVLQKTTHGFLWCVSKPKDVTMEEILPEGFLEETKSRGLVWTSWVPQVEILAHEAVGGFVTHCGWNSCLESLWYGVPMLGWPFIADQYINAFSFARDAGVMLELAVDRRNCNFVEREELERGLRCLMEEEGEERKKVKRRAEELKALSRSAVETCGSSYASLKQLMVELVNS